MSRVSAASPGRSRKRSTSSVRQIRTSAVPLRDGSPKGRLRGSEGGEGCGRGGDCRRPAARCRANQFARSRRRVRLINVTAPEGAPGDGRGCMGGALRGEGLLSSGSWANRAVNSLVVVAGQHERQRVRPASVSAAGEVPVASRLVGDLGGRRRHRNHRQRRPSIRVLRRGPAAVSARNRAAGRGRPRSPSRHPSLRG